MFMGHLLLKKHPFFPLLPSDRENCGRTFVPFRRERLSFPGSRTVNQNGFQKPDVPGDIGQRIPVQRIQKGVQSRPENRLETANLIDGTSGRLFLETFDKTKVRFCLAQETSDRDVLRIPSQNHSSFFPARRPDISALGEVVDHLHEVISGDSVGLRHFGDGCRTIGLCSQIKKNPDGIIGVKG
jgi:hypothetical protein